MLLSADEACGSLSTAVCQVAGWGGLLMGVVLLAVAAVLGLAVARGFGPPITWWVLPLMLGALALAQEIGSAVEAAHRHVWPKHGQRLVGDRGDISQGVGNEAPGVGVHCPSLPNARRADPEFGGGP